MAHTKLVLIFGETIYLAAIESTLRRISSFEIVRGEQTNAAELTPDTIIVATNGDLAPALGFIERYPNTRVIALNVKTHNLTLLSSARSAVHTTQDLIDVIMR